MIKNIFRTWLEVLNESSNSIASRDNFEAKLIDSISRQKMGTEPAIVEISTENAETVTFSDRNLESKPYLCGQAAVDGQGQRKSGQISSLSGRTDIQRSEFFLKIRTKSGVRTESRQEKSGQKRDTDSAVRRRLPGRRIFRHEIDNNIQF